MIDTDEADRMLEFWFREQRNRVRSDVSAYGSVALNLAFALCDPDRSAEPCAGPVVVRTDASWWCAQACDGVPRFSHLYESLELCRYPVDTVSEQCGCRWCVR